MEIFTDIIIILIWLLLYPINIYILEHTLPKDIHLSVLGKYKRVSAIVYVILCLLITLLIISRRLI